MILNTTQIRLIIDWTPGAEKRKESGEISLFGLKYLG